MRTYPEYKDSGVEWIGEIPKEWRNSKLKYVTSYNDLKLSDHTDPEYEFTYIEISDVDSQGRIGSGTLTTLGESPSRARRIVKKNDVIISTVRTYLRSIGTIKEYRDDLICSTGFCVLKSRDELDHKYLSYLVRTEWFIEKVVSNSEGVSYPAINPTDLVTLPVVVPPLTEQKQISDYLDRKTQKIDDLIEKTERKVELLKEQRSSLINQCVTKGLDPNVEMKDSGVEWIGEIPKEWRIDRLKYSSEFIIEKELPSDDDIKISPENVESFTGKIINYHSDYETEGMKFQIGDTLLNKLRVYLSKFVFCESDGFSMGEMIVLRPRKYLPKFQYYLLSNPKIIDHFNSLSEGVKVPRPPVNEMLNTFCPVVPIPEQKQISDYLDRETSKIDQMVDTETKRIELLKEYRQSLISNVVTGKIDVRDEVIQ